MPSRVEGRPPRALPTQVELEALWRPSPEFIGPVGPPMELWIRDCAKQAAWRKQMNLNEIDMNSD